MKIVVIGAGYVGLVSGACFSEFGNLVTCVDKDQVKIKSLNKGEIPIYEPGLEDIILRNMHAERLKFSTEIKKAIKNADIVLIAVGTPSRRGDGHADLSYVFEAAKEISKSLNGYTLIVTKSTVPVGTGREVNNIIKKSNPNADFDIVSNPEFLREGSAIEDFMRPDRVIVGAENNKSKKIMSKLYRPLFLLETPILYTSLETSELIKYASNAFLALKITYINQIADLCERLGTNIDDVSKGMGLDKRIGSKFLHAGPGYGGSCFPKDTMALVKTANEKNYSLSLVQKTIEFNSLRKINIIKKIESVFGSLKGKKVSILGLAFKPQTDDMRESPSINIIKDLLKQKLKIVVYDPEANSEAQKIFSDKINYAKNSSECIKNADVTIIVTEWNEFRSLDPKHILNLMKGNKLVDLRNIFEPEIMKKAGINYISIGR